ncbi:MAG: Gfo/Idh/MocA family protein, partial [Micromonosporaceae bacterium]
REVAARYGVPAWYTDYRRLLAETDAAAVINLTPIQLHAVTTLAAVRAGKHVYSEKPVAGTVAEAKQIRDEARRRGVTVVCAPSVMLFPQLVAARALLADDAIGPVHAAVGQGHGGVPPWHGYLSDPSPFFTHGGGPLADMAVYPLHAITGLLGPARRVSAMAARAQTSFVVPDGPAQGKTVPIDVPDNWLLQLDLGDNRLAAITANNVAQASRAPQLELFGLRGTLGINILDVAAPLALYRPDSGWREIPVPHARAGGPDHLLGVEHLVDCVTQNTEPVIGIDHAIHVLDILDGAARAASSGRTVDLALRSATFAPQIDDGDGDTESVSTRR